MTKLPLAAALLLAAAPAVAQTAGDAQLSAEEQRVASATMIDRDGNELGTIVFVETPNGVLIQPNLEGLPPGVHGLHIHQTGACEPPDFKSAGGHHNPTGASHGFLSPNGPHAGDLPNVHVGEDGTLKSDLFTQRVALDESAETTLLTDTGTAVVMHATRDDYQTDPAGNAGDRIACGVVERGGR